MIKTSTETQALTTLGALAQASRLRVFRLLVGAGPTGLTPTQISEALDVSPTALSFHLRELLDAELIAFERQGRHLIYRAKVACVNQLVTFLTAHCCEGQGCA